MRRSPRLLPCLALLLLGCDGSTGSTDSTGPTVLPSSCDEPGGVEHPGATVGVWRAADGPHRLRGEVRRGRLEIEAGALVCAAEGATLRVRTALTAIGTAERPIVFAPEASGTTWEGLRLWEDQGNPDHTELSHLHHVIIRSTSGAGVEARWIELRNARIEGACQASRACAAVSGLSYSSLSLEDVVIDGSGAAGFSLGRWGSFSLVRVRIQNSRGPGLSFGLAIPPPSLVKAEGVRVVGGASYPARIGPEYLDALAGTRELVDSLMGNAADTLIVYAGGAFPDSSTIYADLPWRIEQGLDVLEMSSDFVRLEPGAGVTMGDVNMLWRIDRLFAEGTEEAPVRITGGAVLFREPDALRIKHAILRDIWLVTTGAAAADLDRVTAVESFISFGGPDARVRNSTFDSSFIRVRGEGAVFEGIEIRNAMDVTPSWFEFDGHGIEVESGTLTLTNCDIRGSTGDGVFVSADAGEGVTISGCNLVGNGGYGVNNLSGFIAQAAGNWWGDPEGPHGLSGDGVAGSVVIEPWLAAPVQR